MSLEELKYFFSYARNDSEFVLKLAKELRAVGANLWLDQLDILGGQHWDSTVEKALKSCKGMIAVLSPESVASDNVMDEVSYALNEGKLVVPVLIRPCNIPYRLQRVQYIDFTADYDTGFSQLLRALGIEQPLQPVESAAAQEHVVRDSTEPLEEKPTEPLVLEKQAAQELEKPIPDEIDQPKPTGLETEKAWSKSQKTKVIAAICIVTLIAIVSIVVFLKYLQPKTYELEIHSADGGSVTKSPDKTSYEHGETVTLKAVPNEGYVFSNWSGALSGSTNPDTIKIDSNKSITASFVKTYSLTATVDPNGSVTKDPDKTSYKHGQTVTLEAVPNKGYRFTKWSGDLSGSTNPATIKIDSKKSITASFALKTYSLTATADPNGSVTKDPNQASYKHGETVILEAVPNMGYFFTKWSGDLDDSTNPATLEMYADKSVKANFFLKTYILDTPPPADGGSVTKSPDKTSYEHGETVTLKADPNTGYSFTNWSGALSGSTNPDKLVMDADKSVTASFVLKTYILDTPPPADGGSVTKSPDKTSYNHGETVTLEAVPNPGYGFKNWSGDLSGRTNPATLVMDGDKWVTASFSFVLKVVTNSIGMKLIYIPAGSFVMGSSDSAAQLSREYYRKEEDFADEIPQHQVRISKGFWMGQTEVTQGQYKSVMKESPWSVAKSFQKVLDPAVDVIKSIPSLLSGAKSFQKDPDCPAGLVSWYKAVEFCRKLSEKEGKTYRLPSEAEWEYACRAGTITRFSFGNSDSSIGDYAWFYGTADGVIQKYAHPVGQRKPNPWGLYDMHGNVWEWCRDWHDPHYYSDMRRVDPKGPPRGTLRSLRGGSWRTGVDALRCACRLPVVPSSGYNDVGFRVVCSQ